jgi:hypothetical protein
MEGMPPIPERRKLKGGRRATDRPTTFDDLETRKQLARMMTLLHELVDVVQSITAKRHKP